MPTYEYLCETGHRYEKREGFDALARQKCETCGKVANRVLFAPPVVFKGSGFYKTDSRGASAAAASSESSPVEKVTPAADTESEPATSTPTESAAAG